MVFAKAKGSRLYDENGQAYVDFLCGAGALNYGHNDECAKQAVLDYLAADSIVMSLDLHSTAKRAFIEAFQALVLQPRGRASTTGCSSRARRGRARSSRR